MNYYLFYIQTLFIIEKGEFSYFINVLVQNLQKEN